MGKANWCKDIYVPGCKELKVKRLSVKVSALSSNYSRKKNYAGLIVYHHMGQFKWYNDCGIAEGFNGRGIYVYIDCTDEWPKQAFGRAGQGLVHDHLYERCFECSHTEMKTCCGGFAIMKGKVKYSSIWLNRDSRRARRRNGWASDGDHLLSPSEMDVVDLAIKHWKAEGPGAVVKIPKEMDAEFRFEALNL